MPDPQSKESSPQDKGDKIKSLDAFFTDCPPQTAWEIDVESSIEKSTYTNRFTVVLPTIQLFCLSCDGLMNFTSKASELTTSGGKLETAFVRYVCRNCAVEDKIFAVAFRLDFDPVRLTAIKFGEFPPFGPPLPARLQRLFQGDVELLQKGFRAEKWGYGVAAFTYYRQVVERQRDRLFAKIIAAAAAVNAPEETVKKLETAKANQQFSASLKEAQSVFPASLMIVGQNPMAVLHRVCSEAIHNLTDEQCLDFATATRQLLIAFSERLEEAIKDHAKIEESLKKLMRPKDSQS
jgi:hypothetical protein